MAADIEALVFQAYPNLEASGRETLAMEYFCKALPDVNMRRHLKLSRSKSLAELLCSAVDYESFELTEGTHSVLSSNPRATVRVINSCDEFSPVDGRTRRYSDHTSDSEAEPLGRERRSSGPSNYRHTGPGAPRATRSQDGCWNCGSLQHLKRFCPQRADYQQTTTGLNSRSHRQPQVAVNNDSRLNF